MTKPKYEEKLAASAVLTVADKDQSLQEKLEEAMQPAFDELGGKPCPHFYYCYTTTLNAD